MTVNKQTNFGKGKIGVQMTGMNMEKKGAPGIMAIDIAKELGLGQ